MWRRPRCPVAVSSPPRLDPPGTTACGSGRSTRRRPRPHHHRAQHQHRAPQHRRHHRADPRRRLPPQRNPTRRRPVGPLCPSPRSSPASSNGLKRPRRDRIHQTRDALRRRPSCDRPNPGRNPTPALMTVPPRRADRGQAVCRVRRRWAAHMTNIPNTTRARPVPTVGATRIPVFA